MHSARHPSRVPCRHGEIREGVPPLPSGAGKSPFSALVDGVALFEGDIILSFDQRGRVSGRVVPRAYAAATTRAAWRPSARIAAGSAAKRGSRVSPWR